jgi:electron transport complex protein RnfG
MSERASPSSPEEIPVPAPGRFARWRSGLYYPGILLAVICAVVTLSMLAGDRGTATLIAARQTEDRLAVLAQVLPPSLYDNNPLRDAVPIVDAEVSRQAVQVFPARKGGIFTGAAFQLDTVGYGGPITLMLGVDANGGILGVRVLAHKETPGLADKIEVGKSPWITRFTGMSLANTPPPQWAVRKDGGGIDQFSGATITPRAVVKGVHGGLRFFARHRELIAAAAVAVKEETP